MGAWGWGPAARWADGKILAGSGGSVAGGGDALSAAVPAAGILPGKRWSWFQGNPAVDPPPNVGRSPFIRRAFVERLLPARPRCHREESDTVFLSCAYCVLGGGRNSYRCMENVTFTAESGRSRQAFAGGRKERICQVFPSFTPNCRAAVHLSLYSG